MLKDSTPWHWKQLIESANFEKISPYSAIQSARAKEKFVRSLKCPIMTLAQFSE